MNKPTFQRKLLAGLFSAALAGPVFAAADDTHTPVSPGHNPPDGEPTRELERQVAEAGRDAIQYVDDAAVTTAVKAKHAADDVVGMLDISVETEEGVVHLTGDAASPLEKSQAERLAREVDGVKDVKNDIVVAPETN